MLLRRLRLVSPIQLLGERAHRDKADPLLPSTYLTLPRAVQSATTARPICRALCAQVSAPPGPRSTPRARRADSFYASFLLAHPPDPSAGLFPPGTIARPVEELFVKHCEEWETKVDGAKSWKEMPEEE